MQVDVTEIFRQIPHEKKVRMVSLLVYLCTFVITIYKCARPGRSLHAAVSMQAAAACVACRLPQLDVPVVCLLPLC